MKRLITLLAASAAAIVVVTARPAVAAQLQASGTAQATSPVFTDVGSADGNTILERVQQGVIGGAWPAFTGAAPSKDDFANATIVRCPRGRGP